MPDIADLNRYEPVIQRPSYEKLLPTRSDGKNIGEVAEVYFFQQQNGGANGFKLERFFGELPRRLAVSNEFTERLREIGSTGYGLGSIAYFGFRTTEVRKAAIECRHDCSRTNLVKLAYAVTELAVSLLYAVKLFLPLCFPLDMAIQVLNPFAEVTECAEAVQEVVNSRGFITWVDQNQPDAKLLYGQALKDRKIRQLTEAYDATPGKYTYNPERTTNKIQMFAKDWLAGEQGIAKVTELYNSMGVPKESIETSLGNRIVTQIQIEKLAEDWMQSNEVDGGQRYLTEVLDKIPEVYGEKAAKGIIATTKTTINLANRILAWTLLVLVFLAVTAVMATNVIGWVMFAVSGVALALSITRALWPQDYKAPDMTVELANRKLLALDQLQPFKEVITA